MYCNVAHSRAPGIKVTSAQFSFGADELAFISGNFIHLDHDQTWSGSACAAYTLNRGTPILGCFSADLLVRSGLRASTATIPNAIALPPYATLSLSFFRQSPGEPSSG